MSRLPRVLLKELTLFAFLFALLPEANAQSPEIQAPADAVPAAETPAPDLRLLAEQAALANKLPVDYFMRLIGRESGFNKDAVSIAGAQGVAQFMPATARDRNLKDPFDPIEALPKSAELLSDLKNQFGNLGLAAAAYNAGPQRVQDWLSGRGTLPAETWHYVYAITGRAADDWAPPGAHVLGPEAASSFAGIGRIGGLDGRKNWELALLLSISAPAPEKTVGQNDLSHPALALTTAKTDMRRKTRDRNASRLNGELSLCGTCIVQKFY
jgi:hypothetical protein